MITLQGSDIAKAGSLQEGIATAIRDSKVVGCFVADNSEQSTTWDEVYLQDEHITSMLHTSAVLLRIDAGSEEASFLSALCPFDGTPCLILIRHGQLLEKISGAMSTEQLKERLMTVFGACAESSPNTTDPPLAPQLAPHNTIPDYREPLPGEEQTIDAPANSRDLAVQRLLAERGVRLQAKKRVADAEEKARHSEAKARKGTSEGEAVSSPVGSKKAGELIYAQQQRRRVQEAKEERARVLRLVEHDKAERKERVQRERELLRPPTESANEVVSGENELPSNSGCAMRIRLLDGSTIRLDFPPDATLRTNVRPRIEGQGLNSDLPYTFKHIRVPLPNRAITISQEDERICELDLTPNANLVLVPVEEYSTAYVAGGSVINSGLAMVYGLVSSGVKVISGVFGGALGLGQPAPPSESEPPTIPPVQVGMEQAQRREEESSNVCNIRRLHDRRPGQDNQQLYNGNQLNFEPDPDREEGR